MGYTPIINRPRDGSGAPYSGDPYHVTASGTVVTGPAYLGQIVCNDPGSSWVVSVYDGTSASGTLIATIKPVGGGNYVYDCRMKTGIYISATGTTAGDLTVVCYPL